LQQYDASLLLSHQQLMPFEPRILLNEVQYQSCLLQSKLELRRDFYQITVYATLFLQSAFYPHQLNLQQTKLHHSFVNIESTPNKL
jgi:hypothetical protein